MEMDILSKVFSKLSVSYSKFVFARTGKGPRQMWTAVDRGRGSKIAENWRTSFMDGPIPLGSELPLFPFQ